MRFVLKGNVRAGQGEVFDVLADFDSWTRMLMRHGVDIAPLAPDPAGGALARWRARFPLRGRLREVEVDLTTCESPGRLAFAFRSHDFAGSAGLDVIALSRRRTRLVATIDIRPLTLPARLKIHSARLVRKRIRKRLDARMGRLTEHLEARIAGAA